MTDTVPKIVWTRRRALAFVKELETALAPHYHCALAGSVLHRGESENDLDVLVYPRHSGRFDEKEIETLLRGFGMARMVTVEQLHRGWRSIGSTDEKRVEIWRTWEGRRVDVLMVR